MEVFLGLDVGSVSTNVVAVDPAGTVIETVYLRTRGQPIGAVQQGLQMVKDKLGTNCTVLGVGTTGSGRSLAATIVGADVVKNEITTHAIAANRVLPGVRTVLEIGGQDSKIILMQNGMIRDFAMNTVCAAGTGSFLDQQAARMNIPIEDFGNLALRAKYPVRIAGRCAVFAESDMIHKQQMGFPVESIVAGLCEALVRNYLNNLGKGKEILPPVVFQGGVAANAGMRQAFNEALRTEVVVPPHFHVMGALGAALLAMQLIKRKGYSCFRGWQTAEGNFETSSFECSGCPNRCEIIQIAEGKQVLTRWGDRCGKWQVSISEVKTG